MPRLIKLYRESGSSKEGPSGTWILRKLAGVVCEAVVVRDGEGFTGKRFELDVPLKAWYRRYQQESPLVCTSWEKFRDPRETTYTKYTDLQRGKEIFVFAIAHRGMSGADIEESSP